MTKKYKLKKATKARRYRAIKWYVVRGYGANEIQKRLKARGLGVRRKRLLTEVRRIKKIKISPRKRQRHIPLKYRRLAPPRKPFPKEPIYRISVIFPSIPVHSRPFARNYLGFRINAFSFDKKYLYNQLDNLKRMLINETGSYIGSIAYAEEFPIGVERPTLITISKPEYLNNRWFFAVEKEGSDKYSKEGYLW